MAESEAPNLTASLQQQPNPRKELRSAIEAGYAHLHASALRSVRKRRPTMTRSEQEALADEIVQEATTRAWAVAETYNPALPAVPWLMRFVMNVLMEQFRKQGDRRQRRQADLGDEAWSHALSGLIARRADGADADQQRAMLERCLGQLTEPQRRILKLHYEQQLDGDDLAKAMGLASAGAARTAKCRALQAVRDQIRRLGGGGKDSNEEAIQ